MLEENQEQVKEVHHHHYKKGGWFGKLLLFIIIVLIILVLGGLAGAFIVGNYIQDGMELSGQTIEQERDVKDFSKISLQGSGNVFLEQTGENTLRVEADKNLLEKIKTEVKGGSLVISYENSFFWWPMFSSEDVNFYITFDSLEALAIAGSGTVEGQGIESDDFKLSISGSGEGIISLDVKDLNTVITGSGDFEMAGTAVNQDIVISGSGDYRASNLETTKTSITITGSGEAEVWAADELSVNISGSGEVYYLGSPETVNSNISGSGEIIKLDNDFDDEENFEEDDDLDDDEEVEEIVEVQVEEEVVNNVACAEEGIVCGYLDVRCVTTPCDPIKNTYDNICEAESDGAYDIVDGPCS